MRVDWTMGHYTVPWAQREHMTVAEERQCCWSERTLQQTVRVQRYDSPSDRMALVSQVPLVEMYMEARKSGVPMRSEAELRQTAQGANTVATVADFQIHPTTA